MSVSWGTQYAKLKTNLKLAQNRLQLLQKKKTEQAKKAQNEIADFLNADKNDRARIRVESIIREDFIVEAYELLEMFCDLLQARFGLIQQMKELDDGIAEAVASILWAAPRISHEIPEFKVISDQLQQKYGKQYADAARMNQLPMPSKVSEKLMQKLAITAPSKLLVEKYLVEIAKCSGIEFVPDAAVMRDDDSEVAIAERNLINFINEEQIGWTVPVPGSHSTDVPRHAIESMNPKTGVTSIPTPNFYPSPYAPIPKQSTHMPQPPPPSQEANLNPQYFDRDSEAEPKKNVFPSFPDPPLEAPNHMPSTNLGPKPNQNSPSRPSDTSSIDFDALSKRFDELKKKL